MKAIIDKVEYIGQRKGNYGIEHNYKVYYNDKMAYYTSKSDSQTHFITGKECEFIEEEKVSKEGNTYYKVKLPKKTWSGKSGYVREVKKEQSKYSGFAVSYAKDLCIADKLKIEDLPEYATVLFDLMVELDKSIQK